MRGRRAILLALAMLVHAPAMAQDTGLVLAREMVVAHNAVRAEANVPPVVWDERLAVDAQAWADVLAAGPGLRHSAHTMRAGEGENLARIDGGRASATALFRGWADERRDYRPGPLDCDDQAGFAATGHYTQIVWRTTHRIGCAIASARNSEVLVCHYAPAGNICGETPF